jgi:hypothetical protein
MYTISIYSILKIEESVMKKIVISLLSLVLIINCSNNLRMKKEYPKIRKFSEWKSSRYHKVIQMKIGWYPYQQKELQRTNPSTWTVRNDSTISTGAAPIIILTYPDSDSTLWLNMDIDDALLGKLIKHSRMTEIPIKKPFENYLVEADCAKCHPTSKKYLIVE